MLITEAIEAVNSICSRVQSDELAGVRDDSTRLIAMATIERFNQAAAETIYRGCQQDVLSLFSGESASDSAIQELLRAYESAVDRGCRVSGPTRPPVESFILVKAMSDAGTVLCPSGVLHITKGCILNVVPEDVDFLLQSGILQKLN